MKTIKRILSIMLAVILALSAVVMVGAASLTFTDTENHWAWTNGYIPYLVEKNVLNGYKQNDGTYFFKPDGEVTRAEFIKMLDETFGLTETKAVSYTDVKSSDWFCVYFQKAAAQGYILNYGSKCEPNGKITREEAISLLVRYLGLNAEQKASASTFTDYNEIKENYRDYILEAIYAGITDGYKQNDGTFKFKPENTLTRAEALTILYRAAGCIYNKNSFVRDSGAAATNNVVTKGNISIQDQTLTGRTIISEGADKDIVTFSNCTIDGTIYIRGNAKVYFDKCTVNDVVVSGNGGVSLLTNSTVKSITLNKKATINVSKGAKIGELNVSTAAASSNVIGDGEIGKISVRATGFTSTIMPSEYDIYNGLTATFAGKTYSGNQDDNGIFKVTPFASADKEYYYIEFTATQDGSLYYYYTNTTDAPSFIEFDENYRKAVYSGRIAGKANEAIIQKTQTLDALAKLNYIVVIYQVGNTKYGPFLVSNSASSNDGFATAPAFTESDFTIKFKVSTNGNVMYFYTESADALSQTKFLSTYENTESALKGTVSATTKAASTIVLNAGYAKKYGYVALMLKSASGAYYKPVIVPISDDGFAIVPAVKTSGTISYKADTDGTLYYYYSKTEEVPTAIDFSKLFNAAAYSGSAAVKNGVDGTFAYKPSYASVYPYIIACIRTAAGDYKRPVCVDLGYESGFINVPKLVSEVLIAFTTTAEGKVYYYFTDAENAPTVEQFNIIHANLPATSKGTVLCTTTEFQGTITIPEAVDSKYVVIMFTDSKNNSFAPIVLSLKYDPDDILTGFVYDPYIKNGEVYIKTASASAVRYYYSNYTDSVSAADFYTNFNKADEKFKGTLSVTPNTLSKFAINSDARLLYRTIVIAAWNGSKYSEPIVLPAFEDSPRPGNTAGLTWTYNAGILTITPNYTGKLFYYTTDDKADAASTTFVKTNATETAVTATRPFAINSDAKRFIIFCIEANDMQFDKVVIDTTTGKQFVENKYNDRATTSSTNLLTENDEANKKFKFATQLDGIVFITLVGDDEIMNYNGIATEANVLTKELKVSDGVQTFDYADLYTLAQGDTTHAHVYLYVQLFVLPMQRCKSVVIKLK